MIRLGRKKPKSVASLLRGLQVYARLLASAGVVMAGVFTILGMSAARADLPVPCGGGACAPAGGPSVWVSSGAATASINGAAMTVHQSSDKAVLNWQSFNIGAGNHVDFQQPGASSVAVNRIFQADASRIFGKLSANGQLVLINSNGIIFGNGAQVNAGSLIASSLNITQEALDQGLARAIEARAPAFTAARGADGEMLSKDVVIEVGATLQSADGGQVFVFAPNVFNRGTIVTPGGQTTLAAGTKIYLQQGGGGRSDSLPGLTVEVDVEGVSDEALTQFLKGELSELPLGKVHNEGNINATTGTVSLVGLAVNQSGRISATTSVRAGGSVFLRARDNQNSTLLRDNGQLVPTRAGAVTLAAGSVTEVLPAVDDIATTVDANEQPVSRIDIAGTRIHAQSGARVTANGGVINIVAQSNPSLSESALRSAPADGSRILLESGSMIDASGATAELAADRNTLTVELRGEELKDSPLQRDSVLRGEKITVDLRQSGVREDGTTWVGTPLADLKGAIEAREHTVAERSAVGGTINLISQGDIIVAPGATVDVTGGRIDYTAGYIATTKLIEQGRVVDISAADPTHRYDRIFGSVTRTSAKWGTEETWQVNGAQATYVAAYSEGRSAGTVSFNATNIILDGELRGGVTIGPFQRTPGANMPLGGMLIVGNNSPSIPNEVPDFRIGDIVWREALAMPAPGFNPLHDAIPGGNAAVVLRPSLFSTRGMSRGVILSNGTIAVEEGVSLVLPAGGSVEMRGSDVNVAGDITAVSGAIKLTAGLTAGRNVVNADTAGHDVSLAAGVKLDVSGAWTNDLAAVSGATRDPVRIDGGAVELTSTAGSVVAPVNAVIDVSGAAWLQSTGVVRDGKGGKITLAATAPEPEAQVELGATLRGVALKRGGSLNFTTDGVCVGAASCAESDDVTALTPEFFSAGGFADYAIKAKGGDLIITGDAPVHAQQANAVLNADYWRQPSGTAFSAFTQLVTLPDHQRRPVNLSFGVGFTTRGTRPPELHVERGAQIVTEPGGSVTLQASSRLLIDGTITAPAGTINVVLDSGAGGPLKDYRPEQALWLGSQATLDAHGVLKPIPDPAGWRLGEVLPGGNVTLRADRGYVVTEEGSRIDVSGTSATLDLAGAGGGRAAHQVASNAGALRVVTAEGAVLAGHIDGAAGSAAALGGTLALTVNAATRNEPTLDTNPSGYHYPFAPRVIDVVASGAADRLAGETFETFGADYTAAHNGVAVVAMDQVSAGGFDAIELTARHLIDVDHTDEVKTPAAIRLSADVDVARRVVLDTPTIELAVPNVRVAAPYVALGSTDTITQFTPAPQAGASEMRVLAQWIDVVGNSTVTGARHVTLDSAGDIRMRAAPELDTTVRELRGGLSITGTLDLHADQVYPATLTEFTLQAFDAVPGVVPGAVVIHAGDGSSPVPSAGGTLHVRAQHIEQRGVVKAPFGTVDLQARADDGSDGTLILAPGSITSVSGEDQTILMGRTEGGLDWTYKLGSGSSVSGKKFLFDGDVDALPQGRIELSGGVVDLQADAQLNVAAGGDMVATEFVPGIGGSRDVLANDATLRSYAIMPVFGDTVAPFDHAEYQGFAVKPGTTVHLDGGNGLPAGEYALLPARYALLPGAFLITEQSALRDMPAGRTVNLPNGTVVVAGYYGVAGTAQREDRSRGFAVLSSDVLRDPTNSLRPAEYTLTTASAFFGADGASSTPSRLPYDAGTVSIAASTGLQLQATLLGGALEQGRGAAVDIAAKELVIVADSAAAATGTALPIRASDLNRLGAESIALGARRTDTANGTALDVVAERVTLADGAQLQAPELLLAAKDNIAFERGAGVAALGETTTVDALTHYLVTGDSAVLRVASGAAADLARSDVSGSIGSINIADGATVAATGAALLDTTSDLTFAGEMQVSGADLSIGAPSIHLGAAPDDASGFVLDANAVRELDASSVTLRSRSAIDLYGPVELQARDLVIDAASVIARSGDGDTASEFRGEHVGFINSSAIDVSSAPDAVHGRLAVYAADIELGAGTYRFAGFDEVSLAAERTLLGVGAATLNVVAATDAATGAMDGGNVHLAAARIGGGRGADLKIAAEGAVSLASTAAPVTLADDAIGATLNIRGASISDNAHIAAHAGSVTLDATGPGGIQLGDDASIDAVGVMREFDTARAYASAGDITLIARAGDITSAAGSRLSVAGADGGDGTGGDAGSVTLRAAQGTVGARGDFVATTVADARHGRFALDARQVGDIDDLNARLNTGEFTATRSFRVREGDVALNTAVHAQRIDIIADGANNTSGALRVNTTLDASGDKGGQVRLVARGDVVLGDGALIDVSAHGAGRDGGSVDLFSATGGVRLDGGSRINAAAGPDTTTASAVDGNVHVRVQRDVLSAVANGDTRVSLGGAIDGASDIVVEGVQSYEVFSGSLSSSDIDAYAAPAYFDAESFMASAADITAALGLTDDARFHIRPGVEFYSADDLSLDSPWDLLAWRFNASSALPSGESGYLTLRAGGDLTLNYTLSDALMDDYSGAGLQPQAGPSWSYRLVAGADFDSAAPFSVIDSPDAGDFILAGAAGGFGFPGEQTAVRTGTGAIEVVAAGDVELKNDTSVIYTVGAPITDGISQSARDALLYEAFFLAALSDHGGDISIRAGGDVHGVTSDQLITDWWWRVGADVASFVKVPTAWGSVAPRFRQGVGALGGGDVMIEATGNVEKLSAVVPTVGVPIGPSRDDYTTVVRGGGDLSVRAGGDIRGGVYFVERGTALLSAGGDVTSGGPLAPQANVMNPWYTTLALGDAQIDVQARGDVALGAIVNPMILPVTYGQIDAKGLGYAPYFVTYGSAAGVHVAVVAGDAKLHNDALYGQFGFATLPFESEGFGSGAATSERTVQVLTVLPPVLDMVAFAGDIIVGQEGARLSRLLPSPDGHLDLLARGNVDLGSNVLLLSDGDFSLLPTIHRPHVDLKSLGDALTYFGRNVHGPAPVHAPRSTADGSSVTPVLIVAKTGDVKMAPVDAYAGPVLAKPVRIIAGRDIVDLQLEAQNLTARDVSVISAGRDIVNTIARTSDGSIVTSNPSYGIRIGGPGNVLVLAGRDINLKTSPGIDTIGNQVNPALAEQGAGVTLLAGVVPEPDYDAFIARYLVDADTHHAALTAFLAERGDETASGDIAAQLEHFRALPRAEQSLLLTQVFFSELRSSGRAAADAGSGDFSAGATAIETLFPTLPEQPRTGDVSLYFSRVYTLDGGDINVLVPGGTINVGLSAPPEAFGISKGASQLGIVAQRTGDVNIYARDDVLVNSSRVFAADGGNILMWSALGDIDAGRGAKTAISAPAPVVTFDDQGRVNVEFPPALAGSGIRAFVTTAGRSAGDVDLFAPSGVINAGDAGIGTAGNLTVAATQVLGADNFDVGGVSVGVPVVDTGAFASSLSSVGNVAGGASKSAEAAVSGNVGAAASTSATPLADEALSFLEVTVLGFGDEQTKP